MQWLFHLEYQCWNLKFSVHFQLRLRICGALLSRYLCTFMAYYLCTGTTLNTRTFIAITEQLLTRMVLLFVMTLKSSLYIFRHARTSTRIWSSYKNGYIYVISQSCTRKNNSSLFLSICVCLYRLIQKSRSIHPLLNSRNWIETFGSSVCILHSTLGKNV